MRVPPFDAHGKISSLLGYEATQGARHGTLGSFVPRNNGTQQFNAKYVRLLNSC